MPRKTHKKGTQRAKSPALRLDLRAAALDALAAHRRGEVESVKRRYELIFRARERGASWIQIGRALGMSAQGAQQWFARERATFRQGRR